MKPALIDTDILSMFFKGNPHVVSRFEEYLRQYGKINLTILTYYEILSGLKHKDASRQLNSFLEFARNSVILPLTENSTAISSDLYANLRKTGKTTNDIDLLIAGVALSNSLVLVTHNEDHFRRIEALEIANWSKEKTTPLRTA